jgi:hypothetical protein
MILYAGAVLIATPCSPLPHIHMERYCLQPVSLLLTPCIQGTGNEAEGCHMGLKGLKTFIPNGFCGFSMNIHSSLLTPGIRRHEQKTRSTVQSVYMQTETTFYKLVRRVCSCKYVVWFLANQCCDSLIQETDLSFTEG